MSLIERIQTLPFPADEADTNLVSEIAYNILYGTVVLESKDRTYFKRQKTTLRILASKTPWKKRLNALRQPLFNRLKLAALRYLNG